MGGEKIYLRPLEEFDNELFYFGRNDPSVRETLFLFRPYTKIDIKEEVDNWLKNNENILFTICENESEKAIGLTGLYRVDYVSRAAVFFIAIYDPDFWSKGYGGEATRLVIEYSFDILNLNRIQLHVSVDNEKGVKAYKKAGFTIEGTLREAMYHNDEYVDFYVMGLLRKEYYKK
jgi:RimJ/RimL family protein N-acetyltransferase